MLRKWIEAMRLRTLPVSIAGVIAGTACAVMYGAFSSLPALLCLLFAILAQIASNFGNEYYDFKNGLDKKGRAGFRRGVTEGDISPVAMKHATYLTLATAAVVGLMMLFYGEWWLVIVGAFIGLFALAYSTGPYPLSHHGLGDVAVVLFFGVVPVTFTCYLQANDWGALPLSLPTAVAVGLVAANVLIVNNYRDAEDDASVGKRTTVVIFGRRAMGVCYLLSGLLAMLLMVPVWVKQGLYSLVVPAVYIALHVATWRKVVASRGAALNPLLGRSAVNLLVFALLLLVVALMG